MPASDRELIDQPYRKGRSPVEAMSEINRHVGTQFNPDPVRAFNNVVL